MGGRLTVGAEPEKDPDTAGQISISLLWMKHQKVAKARQRLAGHGRKTVRKCLLGPPAAPLHGPRAARRGGAAVWDAGGWTGARGRGTSAKPGRRRPATEADGLRLHGGAQLGRGGPGSAGAEAGDFTTPTRGGVPAVRWGALRHRVLPFMPQDVPQFWGRAS